MKCPVCARPAEGPECPCGADLRPYAEVYCLPDLLYNEALSYYNRQDLTAAAQRLSAAWVLRPHDAGVLKLWAQALYDKGELEDAVEKAALALEITPSDKVLEEWFIKAAGLLDSGKTDSDIKEAGDIEQLRGIEG